MRNAGTKIREVTLLVFFATTLLNSAGEISELYYKYKHDGQNTNLADKISATYQRSRSTEQIESTNHGITEIGIERTGCRGSCPAYTFIAKSDGSFRYKGKMFVDRTGEYSGTIPIWRFHELAKFIAASGYMALADEYDRMITDCPTTFTSVVLHNKRKVVRNYADSGPITLWAIEELIDDLMSKAEWKAGLPNAPNPVMPKVTRYDNDPVLRTAYLESFRKGYVDAWERKESLPVFAPTSEADKARVFGYSDGMVDGRAALAKWFGTNSQQTSYTNQAVLKH